MSLVAHKRHHNLGASWQFFCFKRCAPWKWNYWRCNYINYGSFAVLQLTFSYNQFIFHTDVMHNDMANRTLSWVSLEVFVFLLFSTQPYQH